MSSAAALPRSVESSFLYSQARSSQWPANQCATLPARSAAVAASRSRLAVSKASTAASGGAAGTAPRQGSTAVGRPAAAKPTAVSAAPVRSSAWITHSTATRGGYSDNRPSAAAAA